LLTVLPFHSKPLVEQRNRKRTRSCFFVMLSRGTTVRGFGILRFGHDEGQQLQGWRDQLDRTNARALVRYLELPCDQGASNWQCAGYQVDVLYAGRD